MDDTNNEDVELGTLLEQLQNTSALVKKMPEETNPLKKEEIETFVIEKSGELVKEGLDFMRSMKEYVASAPNGEDISAVASLISAVSNSIETLNKLVVTDKKSSTVMKIKEMDIQSRKENLETEAGSKMLVTREELFKKLTNISTVSAIDIN
jgi:hypothetical protein